MSQIPGGVDGAVAWSGAVCFASAALRGLRWWNATTGVLEVETWFSSSRKFQLQRVWTASYPFHPTAVIRFRRAWPFDRRLCFGRGRRRPRSFPSLLAVQQQQQSRLRLRHLRRRRRARTGPGHPAGCVGICGATRNEGRGEEGATGGRGEEQKAGFSFALAVHCFGEGRRRLATNTRELDRDRECVIRR